MRFVCNIFSADFIRRKPHYTTIILSSMMRKMGGQLSRLADLRARYYPKRPLLYYGVLLVMCFFVVGGEYRGVIRHVHAHHYSTNPACIHTYGLLFSAGVTATATAAVHNILHHIYFLLLSRLCTCSGSSQNGFSSGLDIRIKIV